MMNTFCLTRHANEGIVWIKEDGDNYLKRMYGIEVYSRVANSDKIHCVECMKQLQSIIVGERWYCVCDGTRYFCNECFSLAQPALVEQALIKRDSIKSMPRIIGTVAREIEQHRHFASLPMLTRQEYEGAVYARSLGQNVGEQNAYLRQLWRQLHHNTCSI